MKLENQVVSLDLAKRLKELGFKQESLFYFAIRTKDDSNENVIFPEKELNFYNGNTGEDNYYDIIASAYTVAELGEMLPENSFHSGITNRYSKPHIKKWTISVNEYSNLFRIKGLDFDDKLWTKVHNDTLNIFEDTEADARAKMLIYLKENNLI